MRRPIWILAFVLALAAGVVALALIDEPPGLSGRAHPGLSTLRQGGDGAARHQPILLAGWLFGCGVIGCFSALVHFGAVHGRGRRQLAILLKCVTVLYLGCWSWLVWAYSASLDDVAPDLILTLPRPTAIMVFVFWPVSMLFGALFVIGFDRWVLSAEEEAAFRHLVERYRSAEEP